MTTYSKYLAIVVACMLTLTVLSCGGGGSSSPTSASGPISVHGGWSFIGQLITETCNISAGQTLTANISFYQNDVRVGTGRVNFSSLGLYFFYQGTVIGNSLSMAAVDPYVYQSGSTVIHYGSGIDIQNIEDGSGTGSINLTGSCIQGCTESCQTIWSGTWTQL